jgi:SAM-dependent methyltransferase
MSRRDSNQLNPKQIFDEYNTDDDIWPSNDKWHQYTKKRIENFIKKVLNDTKFTQKQQILNAGSGGNEYGLTNFDHYHVDITERAIRNRKQYLVSTIENIPLQEQLFDVCLCVGSVINYCDALRTINEFYRLLRPGGILLLEFENSNNLEFIFKKCFKKSAHIATTFYKLREHKLWVYSEEYITNLITVNNFKIISLERLHILSPLLYRICKDENFASKFANLDDLFRYVPIIRKFSCNIILACSKSV